MKRTANKRTTSTSDDKRKKQKSQDLPAPIDERSNSHNPSTSTVTVASEESIHWHTKACLYSFFKKNRDNMTDEQKEDFNRIFEDFFEPGLSAHIEFQRDSSFERMKQIMANLFGLEVEMVEEEEVEIPVDYQLKNRKKNRKLMNNQKKVYEKAPTAKLPYLLFTSGLKEGIKGLTGKEVVEKASTFIQDSENPIYNSHNFRYVVPLTEISKGKLQPSTFYSKRGFPTSRAFGTVQPVVVLDIDDENLEEKATSLTVCLIKNCHKKINMNAFTMKKLMDLCGDQEFTTLRQRPQQSTQNVRMDGTKQGFLADDKSEDRLLKEVLKNHQEVYQVAKEGFNECSASSPIQHSSILKLQTALRDAQLNCETATGNEPYPIITFGSNIDIDDAEEQMNAIKHLPEFTLPNKRLMKVLKEKIRGMNQVQIYCKGPGCRTVAHYENQGIGSINISLGPDACVWFCVSMKFAADLEKLLCEKRCAQYTSSIWPCEEELKKAGIHYSKFLQKTGDMVFVNTGTYHWVQSNGFATNISWNVLLDDWTQLASAALSNDDTAAHKHHTVLPVERMIWNIAKEQRNMRSEFSKIEKQMLTCSLARSKMELDLVMRDGWEVLDAAQCPAEVPWTDYCMKNCHRPWIFNIFFVKEIEVKEEGREESETKLECLCYQCVKNKRNTKCYQVLKLDELIEIYDNYN